MNRPKISAALATYNEENNIKDCIVSLKQLCDEIVVVDGFSSDKTADIATKLGARVIKEKNREMFHINKNLAIKNCKGDWIFLIDADERITPELTQEIRKKVKENPKENGFWINRRNWFLGGYLTKGGAYPDPVIRLFRSGKGRLPEVSVHEQVKIDGSVGHLKNDLLHFADPNFSRYLFRANRYTTQTAEFLNSKNISLSPFSLFTYTIIKPFLTFLSIYFRHKGYQGGFRGFAWALFSAVHHFYAFVKYWEKQTKYNY